MTRYECFLILITSGRKRAKATSHLSVSIGGQHSKVQQKPKAMRYAFLPKRTGRPRTSRQLLRPRPEIAEARLPPPRHNVSMEVNVDCQQTAIPNAAPKYTKSRLTHGKESQCARRLNDWTARKGGLGRI